MRKKKLCLGLGAVLMAVVLWGPGAVVGQPVTPDDSRPKNVILFISDGCGPASFTMARVYRQRVEGGGGLALDPYLVGSVQTYSANSLVTDSAAGATAYACGIKTKNGAVAVDTLNRPVATVLEAAEARGMATGLVVTSTLTHATPAAFSAHVRNRGMTTEIAAQQITRGIEVLLGGGRADFLPDSLGGQRQDGRDLLAEARERGYQVVLNRTEFDAVDQAPVLGLFADGHMSYEIDRDPAEQPALAEMTQKAIDLLKQDPDGFFLMVEGSRIDHAAHNNDAAGHLHDVLAFDEAVAAALAFAEADGQTLVLSTSDHETGGLSLARTLEGSPVYAWKPEVLAGLRLSNEGLIGLLLQGMPPAEALAQAAGLDVAALAPEDSLALMTAYEERDGAGFMQRYNDIISRQALLGWTTTGHTGVDVNLYAYGPGREHFLGNLDNTEVGRRIAALLGLELQPLTEQLQD